MINRKCVQCGLVNWANATECHRCGVALVMYVPEAQPYALYPTMVRSEPLFSGGVKFLTGFLAVGAFAVFVCGLHLVPESFAKGLAMMFMFVGIALFFLTHIWLVIRVFEQSAWWGLGALFIPFVGIIAIALFWDKTKRSFVGQFICLGISFMGFLMAVAYTRSF
jgi:hypothetical protein